MFKVCKKCKNIFGKPANCSVKSWVNYSHCSKSCQKNRVTLVCKECGNYFLVKNYRKFTAHFCSHICSSQYRDQGKRTLDKKIRLSWAYKAWRTLVFERDNHTCVACKVHNSEGLGRTVILHADHIKPFALYPELRLEVSNGQTLCIDCHKKSGTWGRGAIFRNKVTMA